MIDNALLRPLACELRTQATAVQLMGTGIEDLQAELSGALTAHGAAIAARLADLRKIASAAERQLEDLARQLERTAEPAWLDRVLS